ncbi:hypothetical protein [Granulicella sp. S190]|uniref:hypothetical protein n=1 Tax=Granulicella sp. S190 TaxID=1747226 RepID=UPI00131D963C|nr:hypothetical protein [Granulicella sp. S190]
MRFEIRETVQTPDPEMVLRALEMCSRELSNDVERYGDRITLRGLGPSPRSKNKHDMTVFCVNAEDDQTVIQGEVNFQASALLGETPQQDVMKSKLEDLFEQMKAQIHLDTLRVTAYSAARRSAATSTATSVAENPSDAHEEETHRSMVGEDEVAPSISPETWMEALDTEPHSVWAAAALLSETELVAEPRQCVESPQNEEPEDSVSAAPHPASEVKEEPAAKSSPENTLELEEAIEPPQPVAVHQVAQPEPVAVAPLAEEPTWVARIPIAQRREMPEERKSESKQIALWLIALAVLLSSVVGAYFYYLSYRGTSAPASPVATQSTGATANAVPDANTVPAADAAPAVDAEKMEAASPAKTTASQGSEVEPVTSGPELKQWLQSWAAAMRTRDANAQAAFYADTLDRYLNQRKVGKGAVLRDREATNRMRKGLWTVKMEDIVIERKTSTQAEVKLVKHFIDEPEQAEIQESFVPSRLTLKRIDGRWKITSEQDLPALSVTPWPSRR